LIHCLDELSVYLHERGRSNEADVPSRRAADLATELLDSHPDFLPANYLVGINLYNTGVRLQESGRSPEAEEVYDVALRHLDAAFRSEPNEARNVYGLAQCQYNLAMVYIGRDDRADQAKKYWEDSLSRWKGLIFMHPLRSEYHSRAGATLSNLAVLAGEAKEFETCRALAQEAIEFQKHALQIEPVFHLARQFMGKHYQQLSLALSALGAREALSIAAEERVAYLPDDALEYCHAAMSFGECLEQLYVDTAYAGEDRQQLMDHYATRALALLDEASSRFGENHDVFALAKAYEVFGDGCSEVGRTDNAQQAWLAAVNQYLQVQAAVAPEKRHKFDQYILCVKAKLETHRRGRSSN
jgi:tetratricopeptide (TPR) repeat protein